MQAQSSWRRLRLGIKRGIDVVVAGGLLVALSPLYFAVYLLVRTKMGRPAIFTQQRPGLFGQPFTVRKFRTMSTITHDNNGNLLLDGERTPPFGHFLRKSSLDELPQLLSVFQGDMSLIGPRPMLMQYLPKYTPEQNRRHDMRPGITGWAQVNGRNTTKFSERFRMDVWYVDNWCLRLDALIMLKTIKRLVQGAGVVTGQAVEEFDDLGFLSPQKLREPKSAGLPDTRVNGDG